MKHHPEQLENEIYVGNIIEKDLQSISWKYKRLGNVAYNSSGERILNNYGQNKVFPVFFDREETNAKLDKISNMIEEY
jgi:hypothetical protein